MPQHRRHHWRIPSRIEVGGGWRELMAGGFEGTGSLVNFEGSEGFLSVGCFLGKVTEVGEDPSHRRTKRHTDPIQQLLHRAGK
jgi:hypothetical protein